MCVYPPEVDAPAEEFAAVRQWMRDVMTRVQEICKGDNLLLPNYSSEESDIGSCYDPETYEKLVALKRNTTRTMSCT
eukprot:EC792486.1.p2 GENE.EC792486.1~~EC792486.1.p2  ORF type:complete len:77 (+),score=30.63 EC792486.1:187-417(+)